METTKKIGEVFSDYKQESNVKNAQIKQMNLIKKANVLDMQIASDEYLELKDLWLFEQFLRERFQFENVDIKIEYSEDVKVNDIQKEWINLIAYMVHKYPLMKPMILLKSTIEIEQNVITVKMKIKGADFLRGRNLDRELERVIKNIFNKNYKIKFVETLNEEEKAEIKKRIEKNQKQALELALEHSSLGEKIAEEKQQEKMPPMPPPPTEEPHINEVKLLEKELEEDTPLIYGRNMTLKTNVINVVDISPEDDMAAISGEILGGSIEEKELKSGKFLISFNVYDGTSTISCKLFAKPEEKAKLVGKLSKAKGVKRKQNLLVNYQKLKE